MRGRKVYGESKIDACPFCGKRATVKTEQGVPCCTNHNKAEMPNMKCLCGEYLDVCEGKWGAYFRCLNCGNKSFSKGLEINSLSMGSVPNSAEKKDSATKQSEGAPRTRLPKQSTDITVTSDEVDFIYEKYR